MRTIAIIQARMQSTRLPGKVLMDIYGKPMLLHIFERVCQSEYLDDVIVATSDSVADDVVEQFCIEHHITCFRGSQNNVLERYYLCSKCYRGELIVRLTADNIFVDAQIIDEGIQCFRGQLNLDYLYYREGLPLGTAVEVFTADALARTYQATTDSECLEHVTLYMYRNLELFQCQRADCQGKDYSGIRLTMDTEQDYQLVRELYKRLLNNGTVLLKDAIKEIERDESLQRLNKDIEQVVPQYRK